MEKKISYTVALKLQELGIALASRQAMVQAMVTTVNEAGQRMQDALSLVGLPLDAQLTLKIEPGPDEDGMIVVEWPDPEPDPKDKPKPKKKDKNATA